MTESNNQDHEPLVESTLPEGIPDLTLGWGVLSWAAKYLRQPDGGNAGGPFVFTREQARLLLWWYAVDENGRFLFTSGSIRRMKGWGKDPIAAALSLVELCGPTQFSHFNEDGDPVGKKQPAPWVQNAAVSREQPLALDTSVPAERGYTTVGELAVGDEVFDEHGVLQKVARQTPTMYQECFEITFDDGSTVTASKNHGWTVEQLNGHSDKMIKSYLTTEEIFQSYKKKRVRIPLASRQTADVPLPVSPYILGAWLGDGNARNGMIASSREDASEMKNVLSQELNEGWHVSQTSLNTCESLYVKGDSRKEYAFRTILRDLGVLQNKAIPDSYLYSGTSQRLSFLQGLLDTDGGITREGRAYFVNTNRDLVRGVLELARSLGQKPFIRDHSTSGWIVSWVPVGEMEFFRLKRKKARQQRRDIAFRHVRSVTAVGNREVKCVGIDTDSHLFQVCGGVLTHNTKNTFTLFPNMVSEELKAEFGLELHKEIIHKSGGGRIEAVTSSPKALEGGRAHLIVLNEVQNWVSNNGGKDMAEAIAGNAAKGRAEAPFRRLAICNAHRPGEESVAEDDYEFYLKIVAGESRASKFFYDACEAPPATDIQDPDSLRNGITQARGDSAWLDVERLMEEVWDNRTTPSEARRKYLNQIVASEDDWLTPQQWDAVSDRTLLLEAGDTVTLGFDGSKGNDHTALCACRVSDGALFLLNVWNPNTLPDNTLNPEKVDEAVDHFFNKLNVVSFRADVKEFEAYIDRWTAKYQDQLKVKAAPGTWVAYDMRSKSKKDFIFACEKFENAVVEHELSHDGSRVLRQHILNAKRRPNNYGVGISKESKDSSRKIDAAVTAVLAFEARQEFLMSKHNVSQEVGIF